MVVDLLLLFGGYATVFLVSPKRNSAGEGAAGAVPGSLAQSPVIGRGSPKVRDCRPLDSAITPTECTHSWPQRVQSVPGVLCFLQQIVCRAVAPAHACLPATPGGAAHNFSAKIPRIYVLRITHRVRATRAAGVRKPLVAVTCAACSFSALFRRFVVKIEACEYHAFHLLRSVDCLRLILSPGRLPSRLLDLREDLMFTNGSGSGY